VLTTQKIVICTWEQEFNLPHEVIMRYASLTNTPIGVYISTYPWNNADTDAWFRLRKYDWVPYNEPGYLDNDSARHYIGPQQDYIDWREHEEFDVNKLSRTDPALIKAMEEYMRDPNTYSGPWKVVSVPSGVMWQIKHDRDSRNATIFIGGEYIEEVHRIWK
jgi:hypothetical protein